MPLNATVPTDDDPLSSLAKYIRETRQAVISDGITAESFETGVEDGDAVYIDEMGIVRMSRAGHPTRNFFHGIAVKSQNIIIIFGFYNNDEWIFEFGQTVYVSATENGDLTTENTGLIAGIAAGADTVLIDSQISESFNALRDEVIAARDGQATVHDRFLLAENRVLALETTYTAAKGGHSSLEARFTASEAEVTGARGGFATLDQRLDDLGTSQTEVTAARAGFGSLLLKEQDQDSKLAAVINEVTTARGNTANLQSFLSTAHNPDGTLRSTIAVSTWVRLPGNINRINGTTFTSDENVSFLASGGPGRGLQINGITNIHVLTAVYDNGSGLTTITTQRTVLPDSFSEVYYGFSKNELPLYDHADLFGIEAVDEGSSDPVKNKHVSNLQVKTWTDLVADVTQVAAANHIPRADANGVIDGDYIPQAIASKRGGGFGTTLLTLFRGQPDRLLTPRMANLLTMATAASSSAGAGGSSAGIDIYLASVYGAYNI